MGSGYTLYLSIHSAGDSSNWKPPTRKYHQQPPKLSLCQSTSKLGSWNCSCWPNASLEAFDSFAEADSEVGSTSSSRSALYHPQHPNVFRREVFQTCSVPKKIALLPGLHVTAMKGKGWDRLGFACQAVSPASGLQPKQSRSTKCAVLTALLRMPNLGSLCVDAIALPQGSFAASDCSPVQLPRLATRQPIRSRRQMRADGGLSV